MMYKFIFLFSAVSVLFSCSQNIENGSAEKIDWNQREITSVNSDSTRIIGTSYLSLYSQIYSQSGTNTRDLTVTVSMRNPNVSDTLFLNHIKSYDTKGEEIKDYLKLPVFVLPMETLELVIDEKDTHNGTGGNIIFEWNIDQKDVEPIFEAVMISTSGQQGISFVTTGKRIK